MKRAVKRSVSIVLSLLMLLSMCVIGTLTGTAATTDESASGVSFDGTTKIYLDSNACSWWNDASALMGVYFEDASGQKTARMTMTAVEGSTKLFEVTVPAGDYTKVTFTRFPSETSADWNTVAATIPADVAAKNIFQINSNASGGSWTNSYVPPVIEYGPRTIYFDNTNTKWSNVYIYGWRFGLSTFVEMTPVEGNIYSYTFSQDPVAGQEGFCFVDRDNWTDQQQTGNVAVEKDKNIYTNLSGSGKAWKGTWNVYTPAEPTQAPTEEPSTVDPTEAPTTGPTEPTEAPTTGPTEPTQAPTEAPSTTLYFCPQQAWLDAGYTIKVNACGSQNDNIWTQKTMTDTGETVNGAPVYTVSLPASASPYGGFDKLQFQAYDGSTWKAQIVPFASWTTVGAIDGKFYSSSTADNAAWVDYTPDTEQPTEAPTEEPTTAPTEEPTTAPTEVPTEEPTVEPTTPVEYVTVSFDNSVTNWANVRAYAWKDGGTAKNAAWPGADAISAENGVYTFQIEKGKYDKIIFNNAAAGATAATEQTVNIALEEGVTYKATAKDLSGQWEVEGGTPVVPAMITVYFTNNKGWTDVKAHIYNAGSGKGTAWPGIAMDLFGKNSMGQDIYAVTFDFNKYDTVIFTGSNGSVQTVGIPAADKTGYYLLDEKDGAKFKVGSYGMFEVTFEDTDGNVLGRYTVAEGEAVQTPALPTYKDKEYVAQFSPEDLQNITADKTLTYALQAKNFTVSLAAPDETVTLTGGADGVFAYGETATLICNADDFAYWTVNGKIVSYDRAYAYIVTNDGTVEAVKSQTPVIKTPGISVDGVVFDTVTDPDKILMYFGVNTLNPGEAPRYGILRFVGDAPADAQTAIQDYLDNGDASVYNSYIKEYTDSGVMNSDGRYNYVASAPVGVSADKTMTVYAFVVVDGVLYISSAVTATPGTLS